MGGRLCVFEAEFEEGGGEWDDFLLRIFGGGRRRNDGSLFSGNILEEVDGGEWDYFLLRIFLGGRRRNDGSFLVGISGGGWWWRMEPFFIEDFWRRRVEERWIIFQWEYLVENGIIFYW